MFLVSWFVSWLVGWLLVNTSMQGIYNLIPETNNVFRAYNVGTIAYVKHSVLLH
jgi:hypothetical protein